MTVRLIFDFFMGCTHSRETFPMRRRNRLGYYHGASYCVCLQCGREREYALLDPQEMRAERVTSLAPVEAK